MRFNVSFADVWTEMQPNIQPKMIGHHGFSIDNYTDFFNTRADRYSQGCHSASTQ